MLTCPICRNQYKKIDVQHLKKHGLTKEEYLALYPSGPLGASAETKSKLGEAVKSRGKRSDETKKKIGETLKNLKLERTEAQRAASSRNALIAGKANIGRKRNITDQHKRNLSAALKAYYRENQRSSYKDDGERYTAQLSHILKIGEQRKQDTWDRLHTEVPILIKDWAKFKEIEVVNQRLYCRSECLKCGADIHRQLGTYRKHEWKETICHTCFPPLKGTSKAEDEIYDFLLNTGILFQRHTRGVLPNNLELDFYCPNRSLAIEYHGLYWHCSARDYPKNKHREKYELCRELGIHLIQIFEDEWVNTPEKVKNRLLSHLGKVETIAYARRCEVREIKFSIASAFLEEYHLQGGKVKTKYNLGLYSSDKLIAVMTFQSKRISMNQQKEEGAVELVRFAASGNIPGGFSKLLKAAKLKYEFKKIYSWADLRWVNPHRNVYITNGFKVHSESSIGYSYTDLHQRFHRFGQTKPKDFDGTEIEWNEQRGLYAIFDAGTINYVLE